MIYFQIKNFCVFLLLGIIIAFIYDIFRILRKNVKTNYLFTSIEDVVFMLISGFLFFRSLIVFASGQIRFYIFLSFGLGIFLYILTIKNFCDIILTVIIKTFLVILKYILNFIKSIYLLLKKSFLFIKRFFNRRIINEKNF